MKIMMSKNDEKREKIAAQITVALMSNPAYLEKVANFPLSEDEMQEAIISLGYDVAEKIIKEGKKRSNEKSKS